MCRHARGGGETRRGKCDAMIRPYTGPELAGDLRLSEENAAGPAVPGAPDGGPQAIVTRTVSWLAVDGVLDEPDWEAAAGIGELRQRAPREGEKASEATDVKLLY